MLAMTNSEVALPMSLKIFKGAKVLITGHTGFKGSWLSAWMNHLGAEVSGVSIDIPSIPSNFTASCIASFVSDHKIDIADTIKVKRLIEKIQPDFVFHLAAQALVRPSYTNPVETMMTNAIGTANVLDALKGLDKKVVSIMITSDKAYDNVEWAWGYRETDKLGGKDPYSASKGMAELAIRSYIDSFFNSPDSNVRIGIARAGNVIGGGDWAVDRIVPDCMIAWATDQTVDIRSPQATRPWQHVLEPLSGYIALAMNLFQDDLNHGEAYNFGPSTNHNYPVSGLIDEMSKYWDKIKWNDVSNNKGHVHEAGLLKLNCDKALMAINWHSALDFEATVRLTAEWYKKYYQYSGVSMYEFTVGQIMTYTNIAKSQNLAWTNDD
jgi:CDP-glucose 4,6-dehydratase